jgi:UDP-N-acetylmuramate--alanine ligase
VADADSPPALQAARAPGRPRSRPPALQAARAAITALELGVPAQTVREGITGYLGVSRRMELRHSRNGVLMLDDYAHNPAQITLSAPPIAFPDQLL